MTIQSHIHLSDELERLKKNIHILANTVAEPRPEGVTETDWRSQHWGTLNKMEESLGSLQGWHRTTALKEDHLKV